MDDYIFLLPLAEANTEMEQQQWRESYKKNCACARAIEAAIASHYREYHLRDGTEAVLRLFGADRVKFVLAATIQKLDFDGRVSRENKRWASEQEVPDETFVRDYCVRSHPGLTSLFTDHVLASEPVQVPVQSHDMIIGGI